MTKVYKHEDNSAIRFFYDTEKNNYQSEQQGRPVYDKILCVEVLQAGSKESIPVFNIIKWVSKGDGEDPVEKRDEVRCERYKRALKAFLEDEDDPDLMGTPIDTWPALDVAMVATCREAKIYTVEALSTLSDTKLGVLGMGGRALRERAKAFLEASKGNSQSEALAARVAAVEAENERLKAQIAELGAGGAPSEPIKVMARGKVSV